MVNVLGPTAPLLRRFALATTSITTKTSSQMATTIAMNTTKNTMRFFESAPPPAPNREPMASKVIAAARMVLAAQPHGERTLTHQLIVSTSLHLVTLLMLADRSD